MSELRFEPEAHVYQSIDNPDKKWTSVTSVIAMFKEPFDKELIAERCSKKTTSKWYGMTKEEIINAWSTESERALTLGTWYHDQREQEVISCDTLRRDGLDLPIVRPITEGEMRLSPAQQLTPGIYPEHFIYLKSAGVCGQADRVEVIGDHIDVYDYKTSKKIDQQSYVNWQGKSKKLYPPLEHLDDCHLIHYSLQLSIYMYMMLKHNPDLKPGKLIIQHVLFEIEKQDEFGYPIYAVDIEGNPILKEVVPYEVPYLEKEVINVLKHLKSKK